MKTFFSYIRSYFKEGVNWRTHALLLLFLLLTISLNYGLDVGEENSIYDEIVHQNYTKGSSIIYLFFFYAIPFVFTSLLIRYQGRNEKFNSRNYWIFGLIGILFLALDSSYYLMQYVNVYLSDNPWIYAWQHSCVSNLSSFATVIIPLYIIYFLTKPFRPELFGLRLNGARVMPYFWLILFMVPLIYLASLRPDFLDQYPSYIDCQEYKHMALSQMQTVGVFELCYGFDFISVELFFRGFMVVGLSKLVGKDVILPMIAVYCFLHFGKPMGEAISSIFGGYILGILAYKSRNIFGGLVAHLGVAWGMELMAFLQL